MWGQPSSAVRASKARRVLVDSFPIWTCDNLKALQQSSLTDTFIYASNRSCGASLRWTAEGGCPHMSILRLRHQGGFVLLRR
jgi:hypothetical protein